VCVCMCSRDGDVSSARWSVGGFQEERWVLRVQFIQYPDFH